jgi:hypothetical protein
MSGDAADLTGREDWQIFRWRKQAPGAPDFARFPSYRIFPIPGKQNILPLATGFVIWIRDLDQCRHGKDDLWSNSRQG